MARMTLVFWSQTYTWLLVLSMTMPAGQVKVAAVPVPSARPHAVPVDPPPTSVVVNAELRLTARMILLPVSAT